MQDSDFARGHDLTHRIRALADHERIRPIHEDREPVSAGVLRDESIAEIEAQQIDVVVCRQPGELMLGMTAVRTGSDC